MIHYNLFFKPWHFADVQYGQYFWDIAKKSPYYDELKEQLDSFTDEDRKKARADLDCMLEKEDSTVVEPNKWAHVKAKGERIKL